MMKIKRWIIIIIIYIIMYESRLDSVETLSAFVAVRFPRIVVTVVLYCSTCRIVKITRVRKKHKNIIIMRCNGTYSATRTADSISFVDIYITILLYDVYK